MSDEHVDVLIVGAGLSGIGAACHLRRLCPGRSFALLEARHELGGTWSLFRYPGVRSDSDMYTLGYGFRPFTAGPSIADGATILQYLRDTAREYGVDARIRYGHRVRRADWSSAEAAWTVEVERTRDDGDGGSGTEVVRLRCAFLLMCSGYYDTAAGHTPEFPGRERFAGRIVHPQQWPADLAWAGQRVVVIGSGATAVTLVPALARTAAHVTLLQRSPTYMLARPSVDALAGRLLRVVGRRAAHAVTRWKNLLLGLGIWALAMHRPGRVKAAIVGLAARQLPPGYDVGTHFTPSYGPWQQRLCVVPDGDLFRAVGEGRVAMVTDRIRHFTETGLQLESGKHLDADLVVTATGLTMKLLDGMALTVDGRALQPAELVNYKGVMFAGVPNLVSIFGYTNASWTLKADLAARFACRLLNRMATTGARIGVPRLDGAGRPVTLAPWSGLSSGYFQRAMSQLPKQGTTRPWKLNQNYLLDRIALRWRRLDDGILHFS